ncbi:MAG TPA: tRNA (N6-isopentenyl adenosine(37)-C2)-methylthiotransferase MiaB [Deltaproteobacteria bacterium]|nr:tRNA (N6-isopentenyl adenosine(37)-C2)-methylthiotransferase MiaB [Deltaproteobacteria bacterium]
MERTESKGERYVFIETFGCQMNESDSERMLGYLAAEGYRAADGPERADLILINTCSIRDKAEQKVYSTAGRFRRLKRSRPGVVIGLAGCVAQQLGEKALRRMDYVDLVFGPHNVHRIGELVDRVRGGERVAAVELSEGIEDDEFRAYSLERSAVRAFVPIMRGCDNFCTYCIVPYVRGREASRPSAHIIDEIRRLAAGGVREVTLIGQNVNSYGERSGGDTTFPQLLRLVASVEGVERIRFVTSHPKDISEELIGLFGEEPRLCRHLHLPVQSGSDRVLERMGRGYTRARYMAAVERIRALYPDMALTTDIIVGFPGETDEDFRATMTLVEEVGFDSIFSFRYSPRPGTAAASFPDAVDGGVSSSRLAQLQELQREIAAEKNRAMVGRTVEVLVEGPSKADPSEWTGRTGCNRVVNFPGPGLRRGLLVDVTITDAYANSLRGFCNERSVSCL